MGQRKALSANDVYQLNKFYRCTEYLRKCGRTLIISIPFYCIEKLVISSIVNYANPQTFFNNIHIRRTSVQKGRGCSLPEHLECTNLDVF